MPLARSLPAVMTYLKNTIETLPRFMCLCCFFSRFNRGSEKPSCHNLAWSLPPCGNSRCKTFLSRLHNDLVDGSVGLPWEPELYPSSTTGMGSNSIVQQTPRRHWRGTNISHEYLALQKVSSKNDYSNGYHLLIEWKASLLMIMSVTGRFKL